MQNYIPTKSHRFFKSLLQNLQFSLDLQKEICFEHLMRMEVIEIKKNGKANLISVT